MNYLPTIDRGRVLGGLPDVVTIMEKKVVFPLLFPCSLELHLIFLFNTFLISELFCHKVSIFYVLICCTCAHNL